MRIGEIGQRWYNGMVGGKWKFPEAEGLRYEAGRLPGSGAGHPQGTLVPGVGVTLTAQAIFFARARAVDALHRSHRREKPRSVLIFDAYAVGLLLSMIPIFPGGLGVVELAYVGIIVGGDAASNPDLANAVTAGAFVHRIFTWLLPILIGIPPLIGGAAR